MISNKFEYAMLFFFFLQPKLYILAPSIPLWNSSSELSERLSPSLQFSVKCLNLNSQSVLFYSATSFDDQLGDPEQTSLLHLNSTRTQNFGASRGRLSPSVSLVGPKVFEKVSPGYQISLYGVKLFTGEQSSLNLGSRRGTWFTFSFARLKDTEQS